MKKNPSFYTVKPRYSAPAFTIIPVIEHTIFLSQEAFSQLFLYRHSAIVKSFDLSLEMRGLTVFFAWRKCNSIRGKNEGYEFAKNRVHNESKGRLNEMGRTDGLGRMEVKNGNCDVELWADELMSLLLGQFF